MKLFECETCGSHEINDGKCAYCGNVYASEVTPKQQATWEENEITFTEPDFQETPEGKMLLKVMIWVLVSIIWFAITVFIPPLFFITIIGLIILVCRKACKKY